MTRNEIEKMNVDELEYAVLQFCNPAPDPLVLLLETALNGTFIVTAIIRLAKKCTRQSIIAQSMMKAGPAFAQLELRQKSRCTALG